MPRMRGLIVVFILLSSLRNTYTQSNTNVQYYGFIGCVFSPAICRTDEKCVDDGLFGSCQRLSESREDLYWYRLSSSQLMDLEKILHNLASSGYTWRHLYTQCRVMSRLLSYRYNVRIRNDFCDQRQKSLGKSDGESEPLDLTDQLIEDLIDMLKAKLLVSEKEEISKGRDDRTSSVVTVDQENPDEMFEKLLRRLSATDLKALREFLLEQRKDSDYKGHQMNGENSSEKFQRPIDASKDDPLIVKKVKPSGTETVADVHIQYDPGIDASSEDSEPKDVETPSQENAGDKSAMSPNTLWTLPPAAVVVSHANRHLASDSPLEISSLQGRLTEQASSFRVSTSSNFESFSDGLVGSHAITSTEKVESSYMIPLYILCGLIIVVVIAGVTVVVMRHNTHLKEKLAFATMHGPGKDEATGDYEDLCREDMRQKFDESNPVPASVLDPSSLVEAAKPPQRSSATSWPDEHASYDMDISTGHMILSYMEEHLKNKDKLDKDWSQLCSYDAEPGSIIAAIDPANMRKNRCSDVLPYEQTRVRLNPVVNVTSADYINASTITDHDPRCPAYIATQGPLPHTVADFWQMVWEQGSTTIVCLTRLVEKDVGLCSRYWPIEGSDLYHIYEVKLISEHEGSSDEYTVRSFCLRNIETNETRTVIQFHHLSWPNLGIPGSVKTLMDFRRKVNHSYHGRFCPIVVHCSDGAGQTGTYCLIDMVLNRLCKGAKEMDIAATLEHIRDQRPNMVRTKEQFEFCLAAIAYEVETILQTKGPK